MPSLRSFFYGDDEPNARLELLDEHLRGFGATEPDSEIATQRLWRAPRRVVERFASDASDASDDGRVATTFPNNPV